MAKEKNMIYLGIKFSKENIYIMKGEKENLLLKEDQNMKVNIYSEKNGTEKVMMKMVI